MARYTFLDKQCLLSGADPENIEPGGATVLIIRLNRVRKFIFFVLDIRANRGRAPDAPPLNPRMVGVSSIYSSISILDS